MSVFQGIRFPGDTNINMGLETSITKRVDTIRAPNRVDSFNYVVNDCWLE